VKLPRRQFLRLAAGAAALPAFPHIARAQAYPTRPVRIVVGFPAGGTGDILARLTGQWLSERLGRPFIIENRPGAGSNLAVEAVVRAAPDGYTLLWVTSANASNATIYEKLNFNFLRDLSAVAGFIQSPLLMEVNPAVSAKSVPEFIAYARSNPDKLSMASGGNGTTTHLAGELFKIMTHTNMVHVPYRGDAPAITDLIGGQVQVMFANIPPSMEHVRSGRLRALAVTTATRWEELPDIPTVGESVKDFQASFWGGFCAPKNTPSEIIDRLYKEISAGLSDPKMRARLAELGTSPLPLPPAAFSKFMADDTEHWAKVVRAANIKPE